jgi:hypothetical protein
VAALYVHTKGAYFGLDKVDPWDEKRDARLYDGPYPVVAHPPCQSWSRLAALRASMSAGRRPQGEDGGTFSAALSSVRKWGGVLEHPAYSAAWSAHGLFWPPNDGGWVVADWSGGWTCQIEQGRYGHKIAKPTWLYAHGTELPSLRWGFSYRSRSEGLRMLSKRQRISTPAEFRDLLLEVARTARK